MTDKAIAWIRQQRSLSRKSRSSSTSHRAPPRSASRAGRWSDRYKGRFDAGWDVLRDEVFAPRRTSA